MSEIDDYAAYLSEAAKSENSIIHEFRMQYYSNSNAYHVFFEGDEDPIYFLPAIRTFIKAEVHVYRCGGKPKIRGLRDEIYDIAQSRRRLMFFVDRDFDDLLGSQIADDDRTYITDFYSIESSLACEQGVKIILTDFAGISQSDADFQLIVDHYRVARSAFERAMMPITAWMLAAKAGGLKPNLSNVDLSRILELKIDGNALRKRGGFAQLQKSCGVICGAVAFREACKWRRVLCHDDCRLWIRGKFALWMFRKYITDYMKHLLSDVHAKRKWKFPKALQTGLMFEALSPRIPLPESLEAFLRRVAA